MATNTREISMAQHTAYSALMTWEFKGFELGTPEHAAFIKATKKLVRRCSPATFANEIWFGKIGRSGSKIHACQGSHAMCGTAGGSFYGHRTGLISAHEVGEDELTFADITCEKCRERFNERIAKEAQQAETPAAETLPGVVDYTRDCGIVLPDGSFFGCWPNGHAELCQQIIDQRSDESATNGSILLLSSGAVVIEDPNGDLKDYDFTKQQVDTLNSILAADRCHGNLRDAAKTALALNDGGLDMGTRRFRTLRKRAIDLDALIATDAMPLPHSADYDKNMRRGCHGADMAPCRVCGRPTNTKSPTTRMIHEHMGGGMIVTERLAALLDSASDLGGQVIGPECWRKHPEIARFLSG